MYQIYEEGGNKMFSIVDNNNYILMENVLPCRSNSLH